MMTQEILVPDIGDVSDVEVVEVLVKAGDRVNVDDSLITLESDKASMEVPAPFAGIVEKVLLAAGDRVSQGAPIVALKVTEAEAAPAETGAVPEQQPEPAQEELAQQKAPDPVPAAASPKTATEAPKPPVVPEAAVTGTSGLPHASPSIRRFARELGVDLARVSGSGRKGRILREDVQSFVKANLGKGGGGAIPGLAFEEIPAVDFSQFGPIEVEPLSRIKKLSGAHLHRSWVTIPHVTQQGEADITELEGFRKSLAKEAGDRGVKLTFLPFLMKAVVTALKAYPEFNASLAPDGGELILKKYYHIGIAVDTEDGLVVPVVRDVDRKGVFELAQELAELSGRARDRKLRPTDMQGGTFTISSLGGIGGTAFTPIINAPEVAILGVSRSKIQPVYSEGEFLPRLMLPLSLSYDHRVIDGASGARFVVFLGEVLGEMRRILL